MGTEKARGEVHQGSQIGTGMGARRGCMGSECGAEGTVRCGRYLHPSVYFALPFVGYGVPRHLGSPCPWTPDRIITQGARETENLVWSTRRALDGRDRRAGKSGRTRKAMSA